MENILMETEMKMESSIQNMEKRFTNIRAGRANPAILDGVMVTYYGTPTPLKQLATISIPEARQLAIKPYDRSTIGDIEKAILSAQPKPIKEKKLFLKLILVLLQIIMVK